MRPPGRSRSENIKYTRLTLSQIATALLAACSSAPSTDGQAAVEDRSSGAASSGIGGSGVTTVNADGSTPGAAYPELKDPKNILSKRSVLFDYDSYVIKDQYRPLVEAHAKFRTRIAPSSAEFGFFKAALVWSRTLSAPVIPSTSIAKQRRVGQVDSSPRRPTAKRIPVGSS